MSSRSLAAARARRAGESAPPVSGNRPGTSVGSAAAFSGMSQPPNNIRVARPPMPPQQYQQQYQQPPQQYQQPPQQYQQPPQQYQQQMPQQRQQQQKQPSAAYQQIQQSQQQGQNSLPFNKLSISDAIGLITLRLGRVEQWVIETEHENESKDTTTTSTGGAVDNSVLVGLLNRLEAVEKKETVAAPVVASISSEEVTKLTSELAALNDRYNKFCDEANKQTLTIAKHTEQLFRFERELVETKDILKTFMIRYDNFVQESNDKLADYEYAIAEIEKSIAPTGSIANAVEPVGTSIDGTTIEGLLPTESTNLTDISPEDLKGIVLSSIDA
jgi:hypothetical protein